MDCDQGRRLQRNATLGASAGGAAGGESKFTFTFTRQEAKVHCHYLPARSPLFNPDEFFNGWLKQRVKERVAVGLGNPLDPRQCIHDTVIPPFGGVRTVPCASKTQKSCFRAPFPAPVKYLPRPW